ncbi:MAG: LuxR family transcriptional regulator, partial [Psychroserpens sp.]|nr:LuxR family transcriptional regulator [Psychroserpens sp.]
MNLKSLYILLFCLISQVSFAQEIPPIEVFSNSAYDAENQNWSISQNSKKYIYVANNNGLLEYDGARWQLYPSINNTIIRSVNVIDDLIYTGCYMEFGYWNHNEFGQLVYTSLSDAIKDDLIEDEQFWNIIAIDDWILFQSLNRIYSYNKSDKSFRIIDSKTRLTKMVKVDNDIYFQKLNDGIYKIENGKGKLINDSNVLKDNIIVNIYDHNNELLIQTQKRGFFVLRNQTLTPWEIPAKDDLNSLSVYYSIKLSDNRFALGTISNGIVFLKANGELDYKINKSKGISNNTVLSVYEDIDHNIWLGLDNGINCINTNSPFRLYDDENGILGTIYTSAVHNEMLYLGTNQGLFSKPFNSNEDFKFIEGTKGQVWCLIEHDNALFCGHDEGTYQIINNKATLIANTPGTWMIRPNRDVLVQGNYNGLNILEKQNEVWQLKHKIKGFDISSKCFDFLNNTELFVNHEYKGVYKLKLNDDLTEVIELKNDTTIEKGLNSSLVKYDNNILYAYKEGVFKYDINEQRFKRDSVLSLLFDQESYVSGKLIVDDKNNKLWGFSEDNISYISQGQLSNTKKNHKISLLHQIAKMMSGYENILNIEDEKYLLGTSVGYIIIDLEKVKGKEFNVFINSIKNYDLNSQKRLISLSENEEFENAFNNMEFTFSVPVYYKLNKPEYKFQLIGLYDKWSEWSDDASVLFKNLPYGDYTFNVKARVGGIVSKNTSTYSFSIKKPWYITNVLILFYSIGFILLSILIHNVYKAYYKKQKQELVLKNKRDLELKQLENEQQLMQLKNEKLKQDIENKNRELAISTMSLIKKNEFLNNIKEELKTANEADNTQLKPVIKIIDKNLNNTDDWKFFQEAFNNADKDFLKKVK